MANLICINKRSNIYVLTPIIIAKVRQNRNRIWLYFFNKLILNNLIFADSNSIHLFAGLNYHLFMLVIELLFAYVDDRIIICFCS